MKIHQEIRFNRLKHFAFKYDCVKINEKNHNSLHALINFNEISINLNSF